MKQLIILFCLIVSVSVYSQSGWFQLSSGTNTFLWSIYFTDSNTGYIASDGGKVLKTTNAGQNWLIQNLSPSVNVTKIHFINSQTGYTSGSVNLFKTTNGGINWVSVIIPEVSSIQSLYFIDATTGFIGGGSTNSGEIFRTTNTGNNWTATGIGVFPKYVMDFSFPDLNTGYTGCYDGNIGKTTNGGLNWLLQNTGLGINAAIFGMYFLNINTGFAASSDGNIVKTTNGGANWSLVYNSTYAIVDVFFPNSSTGYAVGGNFTTEVIFRTNNGGLNWVSEILPQSGHATSIFFTDVNTGYITCEGGVIYKTTNGGNPIGIHQMSSNIPDKYELFQNYPNPFNPVTHFGFRIAKFGFVKIAVFDMLGKEIAIIANEDMKPGVYEADWDASNYASGIYYYTLSYMETTLGRKMILVK